MYDGFLHRTLLAAVLWRSNLWGVAYFNLSKIGCDYPIEYSGYNDISYFVEYCVNRACEVSSMLADGIDGWVRPSHIQLFAEVGNLAHWDADIIIFIMCKWFLYDSLFCYSVVVHFNISKFESFHSEQHMSMYFICVMCYCIFVDNSVSFW